MIPVVGVGGISQEPALSLCNDVLQELLSAPYDWFFNRKTLAPQTGANPSGLPANAIPAFTTVAYQQDYVCSGCAAFVSGKGVIPINATASANPGLTESGTTVTANTGDSGPHGFATNDSCQILNADVSGYNGTFTITVTDTTHFTYTAGSSGLANSGGAGITDISWVSHCTLSDFNSTGTVKPYHDIEVVTSLFLESIIQPPMKICRLSDDETHTTSTFRVWPVPSSQVWGVFLNYQGKAPLKTALSQVWSPWPDELGYVLRAGLKWAILDHAEDPRAMNEKMIFDQKTLKALDIKGQEARHEQFFPDRPIQYGG